MASGQLPAGSAAGVSVRSAAVPVLSQLLAMTVGTGAEQKFILKYKQYQL